MERVIGYREIEKEIIFSRPVKYTGKEDNGFHELEPVKVIKKLYVPIYESLGPARIDQNMITQWEEGTRLGK